MTKNTNSKYIVRRLSLLTIFFSLEFLLNMAKIRKTASIEKGIEEVIRILSEEEIQGAIGKSVSYLRKCSDPDQPQEIDHNDSFKLDKACIKKHKAPPLFTFYF